MHRFKYSGMLTALLLIAALASGLAPHAIAQDADATHPIVGMWWWENASADPFDDSFAVFQEGGTYVEETPFIGAGIGTWVPTGERTADLLIVFQDIEGGLDPNAPRHSSPARGPSIFRSRSMPRATRSLRVVRSKSGLPMARLSTRWTGLGRPIA